MEFRLSNQGKEILRFWHRPLQNTQVLLHVWCEYFPSFWKVVVPSTSTSCGPRRIPLDYVTWKRRHFLVHPFRTSVTTRVGTLIVATIYLQLIQN